MARRSVSGGKISFHNLSTTVTTTNGHQLSFDRCKRARVVEATWCTKMRLAKHVENEDTRQRYVKGETHRHEGTGAPRALAKVQVKVRAKVKKKKRLWHGRTQEITLQIQDCDVFKLRKGWSPESSVSKDEHTRD